MNRILDRIALHALQCPNQTAMTDAGYSLSYSELQYAIEYLCGLLDGRRIALFLANSCAWAVLDLAILRRGATCIPVPQFFSDAQLEHLLADARPDLILTDQPQRLMDLLNIPAEDQKMLAGRMVTWFHMPGANADKSSVQTAKLTYTSGTTGRPKGVRLTRASMESVAISLSTAVQGGPADRTLSLLPLSTLLENIAGLYAPLYSGAQVFVPDLTECGITGSSTVDPARLMAALDRYRPTSIVVVPQLLKVMVGVAEAGVPGLASLRFMAVGGARTAPSLIERARHAGLPVYEGYGLSEACSVVSLNLPGCDRVGSTGRPLPHVRVRIDDGEVLVSGSLFEGYLGHSDRTQPEWRTGDLGYLDADGYLHITGRKRNTFATAYGRNVSPEWVEGELLASNALIQAVVFGDGRPYNVAVIVPHPRATGEAITAALFEANNRLPDYARVPRWIIAREPFSPGNGMTSATGAVDRNAVGRVYAADLESLYEEEEADALI